MLTVLFAPIMWVINLAGGQPRVEEAVEQLQQTSSDDHVPRSPQETLQELPIDRAGASEISSKTVRGPTNGRHGAQPKTISRSTTRGSRGERRTGVDEQPAPRTQVACPTNPEDNHRLLADEHRQLSETHQVVVTDLHKAQVTCQNQQQEINVLREKLRGTSALLEVRNQELKVAKTFLSKEDPFSTLDVVQSVRDLNSEIMQTAAHLVENLPLKRTHIPAAEKITEGPHKLSFVALVFPRGFEEVDLGSFELALQGFLVVCVYWIANAWGFGSGSCWCDKLYSKVCETEDHTVASNWRVLTRRTLRNIDSSREDLPRQIVYDAIGQLAKLLSSCGVGRPSDNIYHINKCAADKLGILFANARNLNKMIGENVVSEDLMVTVIGGGHLFNGENMEDAYARGGAEPIQRAVICTTDLGLCEKKGGKVLLKPKVVLGNL